MSKINAKRLSDGSYLVGDSLRITPQDVRSAERRYAPTHLPERFKAIRVLMGPDPDRQQDESPRRRGTPASAFNQDYLDRIKAEKGIGANKKARRKKRKERRDDVENVSANKAKNGGSYTI